MADGSIIIDTKVDSTGAEKDVKGLSSKLGGAAKNALGTIAKTTTAMVGVASAAVVALTKVSIQNYAEYEQLIGGVETLFKDSSDKVVQYAENAYKTAGMTANEYMNTVTGFSASLLQGLGGDTEKAAEIANLAVTDMADNANKMGTSIENIQNAYQGFAKQNYTMLDNLRLGYGGTKEEMVRLLADAQELSGVEYNLSNFNDIIEAIHVVQTEIGITGTTAEEAASTITGSWNMTKSAWSNLMTGMADDNADFDKLVNNLVESVGALGENLLPRIKIALDGIGKLIDKLLPEIVSKIPSLISSLLPNIMNSGVNIVKSLVDGISQSLPEMVSGAIGIVTTLAETFLSLLPEILALGLELIISLAQGIGEAIPSLIPQIINTVITICDTIIGNIGMVVDVAIDIILALIQGIMDALPTLIEEVPRIINSFSSAIYDQLPKILKAGIDILLMIIEGLIKGIPTLIANIPQIIMAIVNVFTMYNWWNLGKNLIANIGAGIKGMKGNIVGSIKEVANNVINGIKNIFTGNGSSIGSNLIKGIWSGIKNMSGWILDKIGGFAGTIISGIKDFFDIHSPSRIMDKLIGRNIVRGIGVGIEVETPNLEKDIDANMADLVAKMEGTVDYETAMTTARVVSRNNSLNSGAGIENNNSKDNPIQVIAKLIVDGKEFTQTVVAPNQGILTDYYEGR